MAQPGKRINRNGDRRKVRRILNRNPEFFTHAGHGVTIRKGYGGGLTKNNLIDHGVEG